MRFSRIAPFLLAASLAACTATVTETTKAPEPNGKPVGLPGGVVRTDGVGDIHLSFAGEAKCTSTTEAQAARALAATNAARAAKGLAPMRTSPLAQKAAEAHACDMARRGTMTHRGSTTKGPADRMKKLGYKPALVAENIAAGAFTFDRTMNEWTASPGHLANIVIPGVKDFGVGYATAADGKSIFYAAVYGQPR